MEGPRGLLGAVAALGLLAIGMFGWDGVWFYATPVMVRDHRRFRNRSV
jgi:hypothetical protein